MSNSSQGPCLRTDVWGAHLIHMIGSDERTDWSKNKSRFDIQTSSPKHLWDGLKNREDRDSQPKTHRAPNVIDHRQQCHLSFNFTLVLQHFSLDSGSCTRIDPQFITFSMLDVTGTVNLKKGKWFEHYSIMCQYQLMIHQSLQNLTLNTWSWGKGRGWHFVVCTWKTIDLTWNIQ